MWKRSLIGTLISAGLLAASGAKSEPKSEPKKDAHGAGLKKEEPQRVEKKPEAVRPEAAKPAAAATVPKPTPLPPAPSRVRWAPPPGRLTPRPAVTHSPAPPPAPIPVQVQVKQEPAPPARVEAVVHLVPHAPGAEVPAQLEPTVVRLPPPARRASRDALEDRGEPIPLPRNVLTNDGVLLLARAGYNENFLIALMGVRECRFDTSVDGLALLARSGLSERLIRTIVENDLRAQAEGMGPAFRWPHAERMSKLTR